MLVASLTRLIAERLKVYATLRDRSTPTGVVSRPYSTQCAARYDCGCTWQLGSFCDRRTDIWRRAELTPGALFAAEQQNSHSAQVDQMKVIAWIKDRISQ